MTKALAIPKESPSPAFDDKYRLVVDAVGLTRLLQVLVLLHRVLQDGITNLSRRLILTFTDYSFDLATILFIATVVNPVRMKEKDVSRAHQCDFRHI